MKKLAISILRIASLMTSRLRKCFSVAIMAIVLVSPSTSFAQQIHDCQGVCDEHEVTPLIICSYVLIYPCYFATR